MAGDTDVVVVDPLSPGPVVVVVGTVVGVVVVTLPLGGVVPVVVVAPVVVDVVVLDAPVVEVVEVFDEGVVVCAGDGLTRFFNVVPVSAPPKIADRGLPEISSIAVMNSSARTNTTATLPAMARQEKPCCVVRRATCLGAGVGVGVVVARRRWVSGDSAVAEISRRSVSLAGAGGDAIVTVSGALPPRGSDRPTTSVGADDSSTEDADGPLARVPPSLRNRVEASGARTATCLTAWWPRSIDCATRAVAMVAAAEPMATPTMVPLTPKIDAMTAAHTAPAVEARIWRIENFTQRVSSRPRGVRPHGR